MRTVTIAFFLFVIAGFSGCVSSPSNTLDQDAMANTPIYEATNNYVSCSSKRFVDLVNAAAIPGDAVVEARIQTLADQACDTCEPELIAYSEFLAARVDQDFAKTETLLLRQETRDGLVKMIMDNGNAPK